MNEDEDALYAAINVCIASWKTTVANLQAELKSARTWQPAETAPTDGREIVVLAANGAWIVSWDSTFDSWRIKKPPGRDAVMYLTYFSGWMALPPE